MRNILFILLILACLPQAFGFSSSYKNEQNDTGITNFSFGTTSFDIVYFNLSPNQNEIIANKVIDLLDNFELLIQKNIVPNYTYVLLGNNLSNYSFSLERDYIPHQGYTIEYFLKSYGGDFKPYLNDDILSISESKELGRIITYNIFGSLQFISLNKDTLEEVSESLSVKLYDYYNPIDSTTIFNNEGLEYIIKVLSLEFDRIESEHIENFHKKYQELYGDINLYLTFDQNNLNNGWGTANTLRRANELILKNFINEEFDSSIQNNIVNNLLGIHTRIDTTIQNPTHLISDDIRTSLLSSVGNRNWEISSAMNALRTNLRALFFAQLASDPSEIVFNSSSGALTFNHTIEGIVYTFDGDAGKFIDYSPISELESKYDITQFKTQDSVRIIKHINDNFTRENQKINSLSSYAYSLAVNIDRNFLFDNFLITNTHLNSILSGGVKTSKILKDYVTDIFINLSDNLTIKDLPILELSNSDIELYSISFLLEKYIKNFSIKLLNNKTLTKTSIFPYSTHVLHEPSFRGSLLGNTATYLHNHNKTLFAQTSDRTGMEGITNISFTFLPSSQILKTPGNDFIGLKMGPKRIFYLNSTKNNLLIPLDNTTNHNIKIQTFNQETKNLRISLIDGNGLRTPITLRGNQTTLTNGKIQTKISKSKEDSESTSSLYVNDLLEK